MFVIQHQHVQGEKLTPKLIAELKQCVRTCIGPIATPDTIQLAPALPKTRSGKITRRILRVVAAGDTHGDLGDISTLADPEVVQVLWGNLLKHFCYFLNNYNIILTGTRQEVIEMTMTNGVNTCTMIENGK
jgi:hypothetical protein